MLKEGLINFRFKCERQNETIVFAGDAINVGDLKQMIEEKRIRKLTRSKRQNRMF
jgi:hypothetical protein